jgi:hypothetical protein
MSRRVNNNPARHHSQFSFSDDFYFFGTQKTSQRTSTMVKTGSRGFVALSGVAAAIFLLLLPRTTHAFSVNSSWKKQQTSSRSRSSTGILYASSAAKSDDITTSWSMVESLTVKSLDDRTVVLGDVVKSDNGFILTCLSHFGDFNAWEMTQQYIAVMDAGRIPNER